MEFVSLREWKKTTFGEICTITRGASPRPIMEWVAPEGTPWVKIADATGEPGRFISQTREFIKNEGQSKSVVVHPGDLVVSNSATPGLPKFLKIEACIHDGWLLLRNFIEVIPEFIYYVVLNDRKALIGKGSGSIFTNLKTDILKSHEINLPTVPEQRRIADTLGQMDDLIAINIAKSKNLEAIAQVIFKSWFIDFDPVKAKMAGEKPAGMDAATAVLFPDSLEDSELGLIPKGWEVHSLDEISEYLNGLAMQKFPVTDEDEQLPVIKIAQLRAGNTQGADVASGLLDSRFIIKDGDILFSWSGTLEVETWAGGPGALNQHLFKVSGKTVPDWYSYLATKGFLSFFREIASGKATTMGHIQRGHLSESKLAIPNLELLNRATEIIEPLISLKIKTLIESRNLAEIRDSLLPRLISGELQIPEEMLAS